MRLNTAGISTLSAGCLMRLSHVRTQASWLLRMQRANESMACSVYTDSFDLSVRAEGSYPQLPPRAQPAALANTCPTLLEALRMMHALPVLLEST